MRELQHPGAEQVRRGVLDAAGADPGPRRRRLGEVPGDRGVPGDDPPELLLRAPLRVRVPAPVQHHAHAGQRVRPGAVVVERDNPDPPAVEDVVHGGLAERRRHAVLAGRVDQQVGALDPDHVGVESAGVGAEPRLLVAHPEQVGDQGAHAAGVDEECGLERLAGGRAQLDEVLLEPDVLDPGLRPEGRAVLDGQRGQVGVGVLPEQVGVGTERWRQRRQLVAVLDPVPLAGCVVHVAERALDAAVAADPVPQPVEGSEPADLGYAVLLAQDPKPDPGFRDQ